VVSSSILSWLQFLTPGLIALWFIVVGIQLLRHSSQFANLDSTTPSTGKVANIES
jgi:uncharacterized membrane protein